MSYTLLLLQDNAPVHTDLLYHKAGLSMTERIPLSSFVPNPASDSDFIVKLKNCTEMIQIKMKLEKQYNIDCFTELRSRTHFILYNFTHYGHKNK